MLKYRDKLRLRQLRKRIGQVDSFTEYLILSGYSDEVVQKGLDTFVEQWEKAVGYYEMQLAQEPCFFSLAAEEFEYDVWLRSILRKISQKASAETKNKFQLRIERADDIFRKATISHNSRPYEFFEKADADKYWWIFRIPMDGLR